MNVLATLAILAFTAVSKSHQLSWKRDLTDHEEEIIEAEYNLDLNKWICPRRQQQEFSIETAVASNNLTSENTNLKQQPSSSMFSLSAARILNNDANETNYKMIFNQLTGLKLDRPLIEPQREQQARGFTMDLGVFGKRRSRPGYVPESVGQDGTRGFRPRPDLNSVENDEDEIPFAEPALCKPNFTVIALNQSTDPNVFIFPNCVRIERCGGCCNHDLLECQPTDVEMKKMKVVETTFQGARYEKKGEVTIEVERHKACQCVCKIKENHCNARQYYVSNLCRCDCIDKNQEAICKSRSFDRFWDPNRCECKCKNVIECSTGLRFDPNTCSCTRRAY